ncbi:sodium-coupled monocarboxylate transporter 2-like [Fopius arisanus]|uniref:Sodium-coupled monocarboxylate transporter 2-like n=1 Tax=Fopius arisanus TaxID=64838 RepID=A0A9R1U2A4_9HYME|nr:PREDICTED: sodium-coupled monocarboxylate transporter 2-like [Fopius arisanus]XP_011304940.1 PREDICTED: sodium-coupled monocarboxylate transporter 2-like [Fopius arisanus]XP_011304941.1 PREDICTED: sodium-coupled monocarboxylate transporter 2-like [Fopius arisanus]XP_011304942.1 PREDICTED: sodium-coupled monocarboxylate transporter 2-like [Fopius arisanus]XP_011304943.1 PREDICTED: sodium-coupled monocarboxylate transporter 2-like [Fopius arisanus]
MEAEDRYFHWADWLVFALMLSCSAASGIWHFRKALKSTIAEYILGRSGFTVFPVSASLIASFISGVTILGTPAEIYNFGTQYWITVFSILFAGVITANVYLPVFMKLKLNSCYEYLELRFNRGVRILISLIFVIDVVLYQSIVVYVPALALNQVTGISIYLIGGIVCFVCVFYTVLGGIRAVVWTDAFQVVVMVFAVIAVTSLGTYNIGGVDKVWRIASENQRIEVLNFDTSPFTRHTVWTVLIGSCLYSTAYISVNQTMVQRYSSLTSERSSKIAILIFTIGVMCFISLTCWCGLVLFAWWAPPKCDPRASGLIKTDDQMLPAYVMEIAGHLHGIPGIFVAGIFSAALSTLSVGLNSTSVVLLEDFVKGCFQLKPNDRCSTIFVKAVVVCLGFFAMGFLFIVEKMGGVLAVTGSLAAIAAGTSFGVFTLGMLFPWANSKGAFTGAVTGFLVAGWSSLGANAMVAAGEIIPKKLPVPLTSCPSNISDSFLNQFPPNHSEDNVFPLYRLSYHWFAGLGTVIVILVGGFMSWLTGPTNPANVDRDLLSPVIHRFLPKPIYTTQIKRGSQNVPPGSYPEASNLILTDIPRRASQTINSYQARPTPV